MSQLDRIYQIDRLLRARRLVPLAVFLDELEISRATFKRDLEFLRDRFNAPLVWDRERRGYCYEEAGAGPKFSLPELWFSPDEAYALLTLQHLVSSLEPRLLDEQLDPLSRRLESLLGSAPVAMEELQKRIRIVHHANRRYDLPAFETCSRAVLERRQLSFQFWSRARDETAERHVSPQRLTHYRDNWYLDAWDHDRNALRTFGVDAISEPAMLEEDARDVSEKTLDAELGSGYGIFSGSEVQWARLRFTPEQARWVSREQWHPDQKSQFDEQGRYELEVPYTTATELLMDVLRHIPHVEVLAPASLRAQFEQSVRAALN